MISKFRIWCIIIWILCNNLNFNTKILHTHIHRELNILKDFKRWFLMLIQDEIFIWMKWLIFKDIKCQNWKKNFVFSKNFKNYSGYFNETCMFEGMKMVNNLTSSKKKFCRICYFEDDINNSIVRCLIRLVLPFFQYVRLAASSYTCSTIVFFKNSFVDDFIRFLFLLLFINFY